MFLPEPPDTAFVAYFGHLMGYSTPAITAMPGRTPSPPTWRRSSSDRRTAISIRGAGRRLRDEIYAPGGSRDMNVSIEKFLGRKRSLEPFLKKIGIEKK